MAVTPLELAKVAAVAADEKKATDILLLDTSRISDVCDYFLICTASSNPQMDSVLDEIREKVRVNCNEKPLSLEGNAGSDWVLLDYGAVVIHIFKPEARDYFRIERLWGEAPRVRLALEGAMPEDAYGITISGGEEVALAGTDAVGDEA
ncbi:MAG: ribosome silencing factor [Olsenella sp.]|nr:ribosome silencing factor [Olsenella sp.]